MNNPHEVTFEEKMLNTRDLAINPRAQRSLRAKKVRDIVRDFNPLLVNPIKVSYRDGRYWVIDGQHTLAALRAVNKGDCMVRCKVYYGLSEADEAELFIHQNGHSSPVSTMEKLKVLYLQGDQEILDFVRTTELAGVRVEFNRGQSKNKLIAIASAYEIYKKVPKEMYIEILYTISDSWNGDPEGYRKEILVGMSRVYQAFNGEFKRKDLAYKLSRIPPMQIIREGKGYHTGSASIMYAKAIVRAYNSGRTTRRLDESKL